MQIRIAEVWMTKGAITLALLPTIFLLFPSTFSHSDNFFCLNQSDRHDRLHMGSCRQLFSQIRMHSGYEIIPSKG